MECKSRVSRPEYVGSFSTLLPRFVHRAGIPRASAIYGREKHRGLELGRAFGLGVALGIHGATPRAVRYVALPARA